MKKTLLGLAKNQLQAQHILSKLTNSGFDFSDIFVLVDDSVKGLDGNINILVKTLIDMQLSSDLSHHFSECLKNGKSLLLVNVPNSYMENAAKTIMVKEGMQDMTLLSESLATSL